MLRRIAAALAVGLLAAPPARAQDLAAVCAQLVHPPVGAWSQFSMSGGRVNGATMRMSVVGSERRSDTAYIWLEIAVRGMPMGLPAGVADTLAMVNKLLVTGFGSGMTDPREHVMKIGSAPAMTIPVGPARGGAPAAPVMQECSDFKIAGWESLTVPGGTFRALHMVGIKAPSDTWVVPDLPFGVVKVVTGGQPADSLQMVLTAHGMGATSQITEAPRPYDPQALMQMMTGGKPPQ
jgi:hypothetical protein